MDHQKALDDKRALDVALAKIERLETRHRREVMKDRVVFERGGSQREMTLEDAIREQIQAAEFREATRIVSLDGMQQWHPNKEQWIPAQGDSRA